MEYNTTDGESMDIAYVRYEPIQDPMQYRSAQVHRGQYKTHPSYAGGAHYVDNVHNESGYEWGGIVYEDPNVANQQGFWKPGNWKPKKATYEQDFYSQGSSYHTSSGKQFHTKTFARSNPTSVENIQEQRTRSKGSSGNISTNYNTKGRSSQGVTVNYPAAFAYEEKTNKNVSKPLQVRVINKKNDSAQMPSPKPYTKAPQPVILQRGVHQGSSFAAATLSTNPNVKKKLAHIQNSYQSTFSGTSNLYYQDTPSGATENGGKWKPKWKTQDGTGRVTKRKRTLSEKSLRLKKYVQPKNALMCLNELVQGTSLKFDQEGPITVGTPICMSVEVNGQKYRGFGSSKLNAKQAAAEAALVSFVKPPPANDDAGEDKTPWGVLASFAMYKLFNEWKEGRIGMCASASSATSFGTAMIPDPSYAQTLQAMLSKSMLPMETDAKPATTENVFSTYLAEATKGPSFQKKMKTTSVTEDEKNIPKPAKKVPDNANTVHPVMLLHQMRPTLVYEQSSVKQGDQSEFTLTCQIDGRNFQGVGQNVKKAKFELALKANQQLFGVVSTYVATDK